MTLSKVACPIHPRDCRRRKTTARGVFGVRLSRQVGVSGGLAMRGLSLPLSAGGVGLNGMPQQLFPPRHDPRHVVPLARSGHRRGGHAVA